MPKKRFTKLFAKPQSTVHPSLRSAEIAAESSKDQNAPALTVNELLISSRKKNAAAGSAEVAAPRPTLPPSIRSLLAQPETLGPAPRNRVRRVFDENGRLLPAGPPPPRSWVERSSHVSAPLRGKDDTKGFPTDLYHLPGLHERTGKKLQDMCLRQMARYWDHMKEYEQNNLAALPTRLRMDLLSYIAVHGPEAGVGFEGLRNLCIPPEYATSEESGVNMLQVGMVSLNVSMDPGKSIEDQASTLENWDDESAFSGFNPREHNSEFYRFDLSGSLGRSISFKGLTVLLERPSPSISALIPCLTHLSLSHPSHPSPWKGLLALSRHLPTLTHLSLAYWRTPSLTPNSSTAVMCSDRGPEIQYGGTHFYSHSLDHNWREAAEILRRLAGNLYALEYLDLTGCAEWIMALNWNSRCEMREEPVDELPEPTFPGSENGFAPHTTREGINWWCQFFNLNTLKLHLGRDFVLTEEHSTSIDVDRFVRGIFTARFVRRAIHWWRQDRDGALEYIDIQFDDWNIYRDFWRKEEYDDITRRKILHALDTAASRRGE